MESKQAIASFGGDGFFLAMHLVPALFQRPFRDTQSLDRTQLSDQILSITLAIEKLTIPLHQPSGLPGALL